VTYKTKTEECVTVSSGTRELDRLEFINGGLSASLQGHTSVWKYGK